MASGLSEEPLSTNNASLMSTDVTAKLVTADTILQRRFISFIVKPREIILKVTVQMQKWHVSSLRNRDFLFRGLSWRRSVSVQERFSLFREEWLLEMVQEKLKKKRGTNCLHGH